MSDFFSNASSEKIDLLETVSKGSSSAAMTACLVKIDAEDGSSSLACERRLVDPQYVCFASGVCAGKPVAVIQYFIPHGENKM